ncbi:DUF645 family protein [Vibrio cholerae]|nr:DUF645 family protein [Vibrio cholerae]
MTSQLLALGVCLFDAFA